MKTLDKRNIPEPLHGLIPMAEKWYIGDDVEMGMALSRTTNDELLQLIHSIDGIRDEDLYGWLAGEESKSRKPTEEYIAFSCFAEAIDLAKVKIRRRKEKPR
jgi:hypothetical protein